MSIASQKTDRQSVFWLERPCAPNRINLSRLSKVCSNDVFGVILQGSGELSGSVWRHGDRLCRFGGAGPVGHAAMAEMESAKEGEGIAQRQRLY